jgi:hypothetical protein
MTYRHQDTLVIVFGAGGRLGRALLPLLADGPWVVVAIAREEKPPNPAPNVRWIQIDVTEIESWEPSLHVFCSMAEIHDRVIIVDLLLDRATVRSMRWSLAAGTAYITRLRSRMTDVNRPCSLVLASTTAVLAPWFYQTPYGLAKQRQLARYASTGFVGRALLLPPLVDAESDDAVILARLVWTFTEAAARLLRAVFATRTTEPTGLCVVTPGVDRSSCQPVGTSPVRLRTIAQVLELHLGCWAIRRDSPHAHRLASHGRLELTPTWLRRRVDHHIVPASLVGRLARRLDTEVEQQQP